MNPVKLFFAAAFAGGGGIDGERIVYKAGIRNKLVSYQYPYQLTGWVGAIQRDGIPGDLGSVIIDSGAFTAWNKGQVIDLAKYTQYALIAKDQLESLGIPCRIVNLDVIPGKRGQTASLNRNFSNKNNIKIINKASKEGYQNMKYMMKAGVDKPIHVFHQGDHFKWLDRMIQHTDYIGVSPANDVSQKSKYAWIQSVFEYIYKNNIDVKTHGFAVHTRESLLDFPWTSCDAASWRLWAGFGLVFVPVGGYTNPDYSKKHITLAVSEKVIGKNHGKMSPQVIKLLESSGYTYEELQTWQGRVMMNIKGFLGYEEWINQYKAKQEFKPVSKPSLFGRKI